MNLSRSASVVNKLGFSRILIKPPSAHRWVGSLPKDLTTALGPLRSTPWTGEHVSATGSGCLRPLGVAPTSSPNCVLETATNPPARYRPPQLGVRSLLVFSQSIRSAQTLATQIAQSSA